MENTRMFNVLTEWSTSIIDMKQFSSFKKKQQKKQAQNMKNNSIQTAPKRFSLKHLFRKSKRIKNITKNWYRT